MKIKKIASLILALLMTALMAVPAFATEEGYKPRVKLESYKIYRENNKKYQRVISSIYPGQDDIFLNLYFNLDEGYDENNITDAYIELDQSNFIFAKDDKENRPARCNSDEDNKLSFTEVEIEATKNIPYGQTTIIEITYNYRYNGVYYSETVGVPIDVVEKPEETEETPESTLTPHLYITGYSVSEEPIEAGKEFNLTVNFKNTSKIDIVENVIMTYTLPGGMALSNSTNKYFFQNIPAQGSASQTVTIESDGSLADGLQNIGISFEYEYKNNDVYTGGSDSDSLSVRVGTVIDESQGDRFEISSVDLPDTVYLGQEEYITINLINKGSKALNNVSAKINSDNISNNGYNEYLGQIQPNSKGEVELTINPSVVGDIIGVITISYEHDDGTTYELTRDFTVFCEDPNAWMDDPGYYEDPIYEEPVSQGMPIWKIALIGAGVVVVIVAGIVITKKIIKNKKQKALEEALDEDI